MNSGVLTIGYLGNGKSTNRYHLPFSTLLKDLIKVKTIYARSLYKTEWARLPGINYTDRLDDLLNDNEIELIVVTTPVNSHYEHVKRVLSAGKNCLLEKPFTLNVRQAEELFNLARQKNLMLQAYQNRRFDSDYLTVKKVIESGKLGDIYEIRQAFDYYRPEVPDSFDFFSQETSLLYNHAPHCLDQVICLYGAPEKVTYDVRQLLGKNRMNDYYDIDLYYGGLKVTVSSSYFRVKARPSFELYGKKGFFVKQGKDRQEYHLKQFYMPTNPDFGLDRPEDYGTITYVDDSGSIHEEPVPSERGSYAMFYEKLYDTLKKKQPQEVKPETTLLLMQILESGIQNLV